MEGKAYMTEQEGKKPWRRSLRGQLNSARAKLWQVGTEAYNPRKKSQRKGVKDQVGGKDL